MDQLSTGDEADAPGEHAPSSEAGPSLAQPSSSVLSDAPTTDALDPSESQDSLPKPSADEVTAPSSFQEPQISAQTESILKRINDNAANAAAAGTPGWEAAKEQIMRDMQTSDKFPTPTPPRETGASQPAGQGGSANGSQITFKMEGDSIQVTPNSSGRGRGGGRPRGRGRGGGRGSKRKRGAGTDEESEDSEVYSPVVTTTKSGRSVQKPSSFVPPPPSPTTTSKRKRPYRRNPESAVCKICLRGTSPANNMIVFCDGCNTPYHRYCHHPPIDQAVVDEFDKEWYCQQCEKQRVVPVPESEIVNFISAEGAPLEQVSILAVELRLVTHTCTETEILREPTARPARHLTHQSDNTETRSSRICSRLSGTNRFDYHGSANNDTIGNQQSRTSTTSSSPTDGGTSAHHISIRNSLSCSSIGRRVRCRYELYAPFRTT